MFLKGGARAFGETIKFGSSSSRLDITSQNVHNVFRCTKSTQNALNIDPVHNVRSHFRHLWSGLDNNIAKLR